MVKIWWLAAASAAVLAAALVAMVADPLDDAMVPVGRGAEQHDGPLRFALEGKPVRGLHPGAVRQMKITVSNPLGSPLRLDRVTGTVVSSGRRGCPATAENIQVQTYNGRLPATVAAHGRTVLDGTIPVTMPAGATAQCAGARFTISLAGTGYLEKR